MTGGLTNETRLSILVESKKTQSRSNDVTSGLPPSVPRSQHHDEEPVVPKQYGLYDTDEQPTKLRKVAVGPRGPTYKGISIESKPGCSQTLSCVAFKVADICALNMLIYSITMLRTSNFEQTKSF